MALGSSGKALLLMGTLFACGAAFPHAAQAARSSNHSNTHASSRTEAKSESRASTHRSETRVASNRSTGSRAESSGRGSRHEARQDQGRDKKSARSADARHSSLRKGEKAAYAAAERPQRGVIARAFSSVAPRVLSGAFSETFSSRAYAAEPDAAPSGRNMFSGLSTSSVVGGEPDAYSSRGSGLQCVPFARENSGIELAGNAGTWWNNAVGVYERGQRPEVGSVLNFRSTGRMRMGHVAVVSNVVNARTIEIDHANWGGPGGGKGRIARGVRVMDVSEGNDWSAVRVALARSADFGSIYPTYGFIYDRPDRGTMVANNGNAPMPALNAAPSDLRPRVQFVSSGQDVEVAEAPDDQSAARPYRSLVRHSMVRSVKVTTHRSSHRRHSR